jgi:hypothetical protein
MQQRLKGFNMKIFVIAVLLLSNLYAFEYVREYDGLITFFGKVGSAVLHEKQNDGNYTIDFVAKPTKGIGKLTGYKSVEYISQGRILANGKFLPDVFTEINTKKKEIKKVVYTFDHEAKSITRHEHKEKKVAQYSFVNFVSGVHKYKLEVKDKSKEIEYVPNDYLTLVRNARFYKVGEIKYLDQKKTSSLKLSYTNGSLIRFQTKTKDSDYSVEMLTDEYGLLSANTYKSFKFGKAYIKATKTTVKVH